MKMIEKFIVEVNMQHINCKPGTEMKHLLTELRFNHIEF